MAWPTSTQRRLFDDNRDRIEVLRRLTGDPRILRPHISVRTLLILVALVSVGFAVYKFRQESVVELQIQDPQMTGWLFLVGHQFNHTPVHIEVTNDTATITVRGFMSQQYMIDWLTAASTRRAGRLVWTEQAFRVALTNARYRAATWRLPMRVCAVGSVDLYTSPLSDSSWPGTANPAREPVSVSSKSMPRGT